MKNENKKVDAMDAFMFDELDSYDDLQSLDNPVALNKTNKAVNPVAPALPKTEEFDNVSEDGYNDKEEQEIITLGESLPPDEDDGYKNIHEGLSPLEIAALEWLPEKPLSTEYRIENEFNTTGWVGFLHLDLILTDAILSGASDVHIEANQYISFSVNGDIIRKHDSIIPSERVMEELIINGILNNQQQQILNKELEYDGAYELRYGPLAGRRTRINVGLSFSNYFIVFRIINDNIPSLESLCVEQEIVDWSYYPNGLFLLCGPTGTGKSTTLASVVANLQSTTRKKIITIEKPIEYIYPDDKSSLVVQRQVGGDTHGFYEGLTSAMRQNPDVILLGEVRNTEEVTELLRAAETGHLAISTMHTNSVATTINRIQNLFSGSEQRRIMSTLADTLRGLGNQVLVKDKHGGRFAVRELLTINDEIKDLIMAGDIKGIRNYQIREKSTIEHKLVEAVLSGKCLEEEAIKHTADPLLFKKLMDEGRK